MLMPTFKLRQQSTTYTGKIRPQDWNRRLIKGSIMLINLEANDYNESVLQFNLIPTEGAVYIQIGRKAQS